MSRASPANGAFSVHDGGKWIDRLSPMMLAEVRLSTCRSYWAQQRVQIQTRPGLAAIEWSCWQRRTRILPEPQQRLVLNPNAFFLARLRNTVTPVMVSGMPSFEPCTYSMYHRSDAFSGTRGPGDQGTGGPPEGRFTVRHVRSLVHATPTSIFVVTLRVEGRN